ncbi:type 1 glutamine amidotransferase [Actinobacteria bacterium YIM 96077]|uniref:Type 1 glutamine amidotransferase n=1 Tax=Phytoactinopolyspora halophila TaxID=1981511 RepID=A0A329QHZ6_9ACTN|nr:type 1 glutamine amidotransferase [Actinobacteria bacterium YIM 96077]RAW11944.1 type 1 glutamine amidotransferase [Phytoactinopolyspora halophila]
MPRVLVIQNTRRSGPRRLGDWLRADGLELDVRLPFDGTPLPDRLDHDALVVLGGGFMPDDDERAPWLGSARSLISQALDDERPVLGICLGGQLLAHVGGGKVQADAGMPEHGSTSIQLRDETRDDPLLCDLPSEVTALEHHVDAVIDLPPNASWLASSEKCPHQAFRLGSCAWGLQFHPEAPATAILNWDADKLRRHGHDRELLYEQALTDEPTAERHWRAMAAAFARTVRERHRSRSCAAWRPPPVGEGRLSS